MFAQLGTIVFERCIGPTTWEMSGQEKYAEHALINLQPRLDHTGTELRVLKLEILYHSGFCRPETEIAALWASKSLAAILALVLGNGRVIGNFVITEIVETVIHTFEDGTYQHVQVSLTLKECVVPDKDTQQQQQANEQALALSTNNPTALRGMPTAYSTLSGQLNLQAMQAQAAGGNINASVSEAQTNESAFQKISGEISDTLDDLGDYLSTASDIINGDYISALESAVGYIDWDTDQANVLSNIEICATNAVNMKSLMPITLGNITNVINANTLLQGSLADYRTGMTNSAIQKGTRRI